MFEYMEYNIAPWGYEIVLYFFLIGMASGVFVLASAPNVFGGATRVMEPFQKTGMLVSLILLLICAPLLIVDLGQPERFLYPILYFHWTSPLSWGSLLLPLFGLCIVGFFFALLANRPRLLKPIGVLGSLLALSMPLYTGLDLMVHQSRELWSNPTIPVLFVILSLGSGAALVALIQLVRGAMTKELTGLLRAVLLFTVATTFALFLAEWVVLNYGTEELQQAWGIINSEYALQYWGLTFVVGILLPLLLLAWPRLAKDPRWVTLAGMLSAVGAYWFREVLIYAGQLTQIYF